MRLQSINIGAKHILNIGDEAIETGIVKTPVTGPVNISVECVGDDAIINRKVHGGVDQAVYIYGGADYEWWSNQLGARVTARHLWRKPDHYRTRKRPDQGR